MHGADSRINSAFFLAEESVMSSLLGCSA